MSTIVCPHCQADLDDDTFASTGSTNCPFCGEDVSKVLPTATPSISTPDESQPTSWTAAELGLPKDSRIQLMEATASREVIYIPPGSNEARSTGCFALFWNLMLLGMTGFVIVRGVQDNPIMGVVFSLLFFWVIGIFLMIWWINTRFTRTFLLLEESRFVIQRILFGRKSIKEVPLNTTTKVALVEAYRSNKKPVMAVSVSTPNPDEQNKPTTVKFGTALLQGEKLWLVDRVTSFVHPNPPPLKLQTAPYLATAEAPPKIRAGELPSNSVIVVDEDSPNALRLHFRGVPPGAIANGISLAGILFGLLWIVGSGLVILGWPPWEASLPAMIFAAFFCGSGLIPAAVALFVHWGSISVELNSQQFRCRWHVGPFAYRKTIPTAKITRVAVLNPIFERARLKGETAPAGSSQSSDKVCVVMDGETIVPITAFHTLQTSREMAGLLHNRLREMGFALEA